ncbi:aminotransferase class V-fold PLP-dependent enzyme [Salinarimonas sp.]|uniref:pyridoxal phosphate-dependent decarboxylase family protein n=1 Tax=Salinarimonas sp. TaxID=2766526 RepID=UPI0032D8C35B
MIRPSGMPAEGVPASRVLEMLRTRKRADYDWRRGRVGFYVYEKDPQFTDFLAEAYREFFVENALGGDAFPSVAELEDEVVAMVAALMQAPSDAAGAFTSGGSESIFLALKTARDAKEGAPAALNVVVPETAHPAFDKACAYLGMTVRRTAVDASGRAVPSAMADALDPLTAAMVASAPQYPHGVFDPVEDLGEIAARAGVWLHVDACVGGMLAPFVRRLGHPIPDFDFSVRGVRSISVDLHKYGMAARGASVLLLRDEAALRHLEFSFSSWPRGAYGTRTVTGSRPAGAVAAAWAAMQALGESGYLEIARQIVDSKRRLVRGIADIDGLCVHEPSELSIVLIKSADPDLDVFAVSDLMLERGWYLGRSLRPAAIHLALNPLHTGAIAPLLADLAEASARARSLRLSGRTDGPAYGVGRARVDPG